MGYKRCAVIEVKEDIDSLIMLEYLQREEMVDYIIFDPMPDMRKETIKERVSQIKAFGLKILDEIVECTEIIYNIGAYTKIADYLESEHAYLKYLFSSDGFAGTNIVNEADELREFKNIKYSILPRLNSDVESGEFVVKTPALWVENIVMTSKNVSCSHINTREYLYRGVDYDWLDKYNLFNGQHLHSLLMAVEAKNILSKNKPILKYKRARMVTKDGIRGVHTSWGVEEDYVSNLWITIGFDK